MRLITHNLLVCNVKACVETASRTTDSTKNFPLRVEPAAEGGLAQVESEFSPELIAHLLPKLHWGALRQVAGELGIAELPPAMPESPAEDPAFLRSVHDLIMDVHVMEGALVCPNCARRYPIKGGVPNMLLREDEV